MKKPSLILTWGIGAAAVIGAICVPSHSSGQAPGDEQAIAQFVAEIAGQQAKITANQQAMDEKITAIEENMRLARIFVSRAGGVKK